MLIVVSSGKDFSMPSEISVPLIDSLKERIGLRQLIGDSPAFVDEINKIPSMAKCDAGVLISGDTGTGKELCARAIHYLSPRAGYPFIPVNCGAIPTDLVENELFGHVQGAFTSATTSRPGLIEEADKGTLFLDEIDCLPLQAQVKLLRFLQDKAYKQLGCSKVRQSDVRIIAASNTNLEKSAFEGKFRRDLYYRLNVIPLKLPLLRDRQEDVPLLARHFLEKYAMEFDKPVLSFSPGALRRLMVYEWPGNVRELENVIARAVVFSCQGEILEEDIMVSQTEPPAKKESLKTAKSKAIAQFEKNYIQGLLMSHQGNISRAAKEAQKNRRAFWQLMRKHQIDAQAFKIG
jgi:two-component system, NtrC family, response regulator GlrR